MNTGYRCRWSCAYALVLILAAGLPQARAAGLFVDESAAVALATGPGVQHWPDIDGDRVVWVEDAGGISTLYAADLSNPGLAPTPLATGSILEPEIDGTRVVYHDNDDYHVYMVDLADTSPTPIRLTSVASDNNTQPSVSGDRAVWTQQSVTDIIITFIVESEVHGIDLADLPGGDFQITDHAGAAQLITSKVSGDWLAYTVADISIGGSPSELYLLDLNDPSTAPVLIDTSSALGNPLVNDDWVVWNHSVGTNLWQIQVAEVGDPVASTRPLAISATDQLLGDLYGDIVLFRRFGSGSSEIYGIDASDPSATPFPVVQSGGFVHDQFVKISGDTILYSQGGDIYVNHIVPEPAAFGCFTFLIGLVGSGRARGAQGIRYP